MKTFIVLSIVAAICISDVRAACRTQCPLGAINFFSLFCSNVCDCDSSPCSRGSCTESDTSFVCTCEAGYTGETCSTNINECDSNPCLNEGSCVDLINEFSCNCPLGYSGEKCENTPGNKCCPNPCNSGTCTLDENAESGYDCTCIAGYTGENCETDINECATENCNGRGTCIQRGLNASICECQTGYTGDNCESDVNDCLAYNPCVNGGTCVDDGLLNSVSCTSCDNGYTGQFCEINIDDCLGITCSGNGDCIDDVGSHKCLCDVGFSGDDCSNTANACSATPCLNGGTCSASGEDTIQCTGCDADYTGSQCETKIDHCDGVTCSNGGTCVDDIGTYKCMCAAGYKGSTCDETVDSCSTTPCLNGGTCSQNGPNDFTCTGCSPDYTGNKCETKINGCDSITCQNGGQCIDGNNGVGDAFCVCNSFYTGTFCQTALTCPVGFTAVEGVGCLTLTATALPHATASFFCTLVKGNLYSFEPTDNLANLRTFYSTSYPNADDTVLWIGLTLNTASSQWEWVSGLDNQPSFTDGHKSEVPSGACGALAYDDTLSNDPVHFIRQDCNTAFPVICEVPPFHYHTT